MESSLKKYYSIRYSLMILYARLTIVALFAVSLFPKVFDFSTQAAWIWTNGITFMPKILLFLAIILEFVGIVLIFLGYKMRYGAWCLIVFTLFVTFMFHVGDGQLMMFFKNIAITGGLLALSLLHPGRVSLTGLRRE